MKRWLESGYIFQETIADAGEGVALAPLPPLTELADKGAAGSGSDHYRRCRRFVVVHRRHPSGDWEESHWMVANLDWLTLSVTVKALGIDAYALGSI